MSRVHELHRTADDNRPMLDLNTRMRVQAEIEARAQPVRTPSGRQDNEGRGRARG